ncbi:MAG: hypothetical protein V3V33_04555 [Candidatus Lokiarchaeia archaeon]
MSKKPKRREHWNKVARINEKEINTFFKNFCNWEFVAPNTDIMGGGIDTIFTYFNLFTGKNELILIESKHDEYDYISPTVLGKQIEKLKTQIESFRDKANKIPEVYEDIENLEGIINKGILVHRFEDFSKEQFDNILYKVKLGKNRQFNPPTIFLIHNYQIARFAELYKETVRSTLYWYYPPFGTNYSHYFYKSPIPSYLQSEIGFLLPRDKDSDTLYSYKDIEERSLIFYSFEKPTMNLCEYIASLFKTTPIKPEQIKGYFFFRGDHAEKKTYLNNLKRVNINIEEPQIWVDDVIDSKINDFEVIFKK